jgi:hypothetical protein
MYVPLLKFYSQTFHFVAGKTISNDDDDDDDDAVHDEKRRQQQKLDTSDESVLLLRKSATVLCEPQMVGDENRPLKGTPSTQCHDASSFVQYE